METPDQVVVISTYYLCYQKMLTKPSNFKECDKKTGANVTYRKVSSGKVNNEKMLHPLAFYSALFNSANHF